MERCVLLSACLPKKTSSGSVSVDNNLKTVFVRCEGVRIVYYKINALGMLDFWDKHWEDSVYNVSKEYYRPYLKGFLGYGRVQDVFNKFLPRKGLILEAGCGTGRYVISLRARGYNCFGVDSASKTVQKIKDYFPDLPVEVGDICKLNLKDESIDAYISLGVMEHFKEGPYTAIKEACRVLKKKGIILVSVPQIVLWRKLQAHPEGTPLPENASFYQYAFSVDEFRSNLLNAGFRIKGEYGYYSHYAFTLRFNFFRKALKIFRKLALLDLIIDRMPVGKNISRMRLYVAEKI